MKVDVLRSILSKTKQTSLQSRMIEYFILFIFGHFKLVIKTTLSSKLCRVSQRLPEAVSVLIHMRLTVNTDNRLYTVSYGLLKIFGKAICF